MLHGSHVALLADAVTREYPVEEIGADRVAGDHAESIDRSQERLREEWLFRRSTGKAHRCDHLRFRQGLPRECERSERRLERVLLRLFNAPGFDEFTHRELGGLIRELRRDLVRLSSLRKPKDKLRMPQLFQSRAIPHDHAGGRR